MAVIGLRQLQRGSGRIFEDLERTGEPVVITRQGRPIAALIPVDESRMEELILSTVPGVAESVRDTASAVEEGRTASLEEVEADLDLDRPDVSEPRRFAGTPAAVPASGTASARDTAADDTIAELSHLVADSPDLGPLFSTSAHHAALDPAAQEAIAKLSTTLLESTLREAFVVAKQRFDALAAMTAREAGRHPDSAAMIGRLETYAEVTEAVEAEVFIEVFEDDEEALGVIEPEHQTP